MTAFIDYIDITAHGEVIVAGHLSRTGLSVSLSEYVYVMPPQDGMWEYDLTVSVDSDLGATMLVPFLERAHWTGDADANGCRIHIKEPGSPPRSISFSKVKKVEDLTTTHENLVWIEGAHYDKARNVVVIDISYSGGCVSHQFALEWDGATIKTEPPQYKLNLVDLSPQDPCEAMISQQLRLDIVVPDVRFARPSTLLISTPTGGQQVRVPLT